METTLCYLCFSYLLQYIGLWRAAVLVFNKVIHLHFCNADWCCFNNATGSPGPTFHVVTLKLKTLFSLFPIKLHVNGHHQEFEVLRMA